MCENNIFTIDKLITNNPYSLYGKYKNRWIFYDSIDIMIYETSKFKGHNIIEINRTDFFDEIIVGPLPKKPHKMFIKILDQNTIKKIKCLNLN